MDLRSALIATSIAAGLSAVATIAVRYLLASRPWAAYVFKPLTTCLILITALIPATRQQSIYGTAVVVGLCFAVAGDVLLMLPADHFIAGLTSFLLANVIYAFAFVGTGALTGFPWPVLPIVLVGVLVLLYLWSGLAAPMRGPVSAYVLVMVIMASLAAYRAFTNPLPGTLCAAIGAFLYLISDAMLAVSRFRRPFFLAQALVLSSYYTGQLLIALSVGLSAGLLA